MLKIAPRLLFLLALVVFPTRASALQLKIGWIGPLTSDSAVLGIDSANVMTMGVESWNKTHADSKLSLQLLVDDDQYITSKSLSAYKRQAALGVKIIFVLNYGAMLSLAPQAERDDIILIDPLDCDEELAALAKNSFCMAKTTELLGVLNAKAAIENADDPAAIIYRDGDPFAPKVAQATRDTLLAAHIKVPIYEGIPGDQVTDFRSILARVKQLRPKALFLYGADNFGFLARQAREIGFAGQIYSLAAVNSDGFIKNAAGAIENAIVTGWFAKKTAAYLAFRERYAERFGKEPIFDLSTIPTQDLLTLLLQNFERFSERDQLPSADEIRSILMSTKDYPGLAGTITMDPDGAVRSLPVGVYRFRDRNFLPLD
jgi:ABC-type branched-subunit amino acid transport system substrate-binding protein